MPSGGDIDNIDSRFRQFPGKKYRILQGNSSRGQLDRAETVHYGKSFTHFCADSPDTHHRERDSFLKRAPKIVFALIGEWRKKLMQEVAVSAVNIYSIEANISASARGKRKSFCRRFQFRGTDFPIAGFGGRSHLIPIG